VIEGANNALAKPYLREVASLNSRAAVANRRLRALERGEGKRSLRAGPDEGVHDVQPQAKNPTQEQLSGASKYAPPYHALTRT